MSTDQSVSHEARLERDRRIRFAVVAGLAGRGLSMLISLISLPLSLSILDKDRYGVWLTVGSLLAWLGLADIGLGNSIITPLTSAVAAGDRKLQREIVSTPFFAIAGICCLLAAVMAVAVPMVSWQAVLGAPATVSEGELRSVVSLATAMFVISLPLGMADRVLAGLQESHKATIWSILTNVISCATLAAVAHFGGGITGLILATSGVGVLLRVALWAQLVSDRAWLLPQVSAMSRSRARATLRTGLSFLLVQVIGIAVYQTDNIVVAQLFGAGAVTEYAVPFRLALLATGLAGLFMGPMWPAYADALARGDMQWFRLTLRRGILHYVGGALLAGASIALLGVWAVKLWTRGTVVPDQALLAVVGLYIPIHVACQVTSAALNALGRLRSQIVYGGAATIVNLVLSIVLGRSMGLPGVCLATCLATLLPAFATGLELRRAMKNC